LKVLLIRFSSIGDIVLTSPVIRCIKKQLNAEVHFVTKIQFKEIIEANPHVEKTHCLAENMGELIEQLKEEQFDLVIDLHKNLRSARIVRALKTKHRSFDKLNYKKWLLVNTKINFLPSKHLVDRYFDGIKPIGVVNDNEGLDFFLKEKDFVNLNEVSQNVIKDDFIAIAFGAAHNTKSIPENKLMEIISLLTIPVVLIGGPGEKKIADSIAKAFPAKVFHTCGETSINQSASIIDQSKMLLSADTGMMHIAAALKKKTIVFWGSTVPDFGMYPYREDSKNNVRFVENSTLKCRPCSKIGYNKCPKGHFKCMNYSYDDDLAKCLSELNVN
jgi:heptosyltransferase-2